MTYFTRVKANFKEIDVKYNIKSAYCKLGNFNCSYSQKHKEIYIFMRCLAQYFTNFFVGDENEIIRNFALNFY